MRIAVIGQSLFGAEALRRLASHREWQVVAAFCPPDSRNPEPVKAAAVENGVTAFQFKRLRSAEAVQAFKNTAPDLCVMAYVTDIVPIEILDCPILGTIQYHPSLLPKHRGPSAINWALIHGGVETGLTIFWTDQGLDTGSILLQEKVSIAPDDTVGSLYFDQLFPKGIAAIEQAVGLVAAGCAPKIVQDESQATYEGWCGAAQTRIDWTMPAQRVFNLIRGSDPQPGAHSRLGNTKVQFYSCSLLAGVSDGAPTSPGTIVAHDDTSFVVSAAGGRIRVGRVRVDGGKKVSANVWLVEQGITVPAQVMFG